MPPLLATLSLRDSTTWPPAGITTSVPMVCGASPPERIVQPPRFTGSAPWLCTSNHSPQLAESAATGSPMSSETTTVVGPS